MATTWTPSHWTRAPLEKRRLSAQGLLEAGQRISTQIAEQTGVSASAVRMWRLRLRRDGSLAATVAPGPPSRLNDAQVAEVMPLLQAGPDPERCADQRWTCPRVRELIGLRFGVWYDALHLSRLLHQWGLTPQQPVKRAAEQDQDAVAHWLETHVPVLEKNERGGHAGLRR